MLGVPRVAVFCFSAVTAVCLAVGVLGVAVGVPAHAASPVAFTAQQLTPVTFLLGLWALLTAFVCGLAMARARVLAGGSSSVVGVCVRGGLWIWGVAGCTWLYVWACWSVGFYGWDADGSTLGPAPWVLVVAAWWCGLAFVALPVATVVSLIREVVRAVHDRRSVKASATEVVPTAPAG